VGNVIEKYPLGGTKSKWDVVFKTDLRVIGVKGMR
jgi:hypothetical protein